VKKKLAKQEIKGGDTRTGTVEGRECNISNSKKETQGREQLKVAWENPANGTERGALRNGEDPLR